MNVYAESGFQKDRMEHANKHRWVSIVGNYALSLAKIITCQCYTVSRFLIALLMLMQFMTKKSTEFVRKSEKLPFSIYMNVI